MPKATKLHSKGKSSSIQKPCKVQTDVTENLEPEEAARQFQLELCWCIQQLERSLKEKKGNEKQLQEAWKVLTVLKNNNQPVIRKRQLMRTHFGDYRAKMAAEETKLVKMTSKIKIVDSPAQSKATFLRKSIFATTGDSSFRFNFDLKPHQIADKNSELNKQEDQCKNEVTLNTDLVQSEPVKEDSKLFKFSFTNSQFKFNFNKDSNNK